MNHKDITNIIQNENNIQNIKRSVSTLDYNFIDYGLDRIVLEIPDSEKYVLKIARNCDKNKLNEIEYKNYMNLKNIPNNLNPNTTYGDWLCPVKENDFGCNYSYILMDKVDTKKGDYVNITNNLIDICSAEEISSHNVGKHSHLGDVLIDYTYRMY